MDDEEFYAWLDSLAPAERQQVEYELGYAGANQVPGQFAMGGMSPELGMGSFDLGSYGQLPPELNKQGEVVPWGLDQEAQAYNALQDVGAMTVDNALAMYGGGGAYDPGAFQGTTVPIGQPMDQSDRRYLENLANSGSGYESFIAQRILEGKSAGTAQAEMWRFINEDVAPENAELKAMLVESLPDAAVAGGTGGIGGGLPSARKNVGDFTTPEGRAATVDLQGLNRFAQDLFERKSKIQEPGYVDESGLEYLGARKEPSALTKKFETAGIPLPTESYGSEEWLNAPLTEESVLGRQEREGKAQERYGGAIEDVNRFDKMLPEMEQAWAESAEARRGIPQTTTNPDFGTAASNPYNLPADVWREAAATGRENFSDQGNAGAPELATFMQQALADANIPVVNGIPTSAMAKERQRQTEAARAEAEAEYGKALFDWRGEAQSQAGQDAQRETAASRLGSGEPWAVTGPENELFGTFNFAGTPEEQQNLGRFAAVMSAFKGGGEPEAISQRLAGTRFGQMNPETLGVVRRGGQAARGNRQAALQNQIRQHDITGADEAARATAIGRSIALQRAGRTPMNDILMQRAMARQQLMGR